MFVLPLNSQPEVFIISVHPVSFVNSTLQTQPSNLILRSTFLFAWANINLSYSFIVVDEE